MKPGQKKYRVLKTEYGRSNGYHWEPFNPFSEEIPVSKVRASNKKQYEKVKKLSTRNTQVVNNLHVNPLLIVCV